MYKTIAMKKRFYLLAMLLTVWNDLCGQNDFERYALEQEAAFKAYSDKEEADFKTYSDSVNREFGRYLAEAWPDCPLIKPNNPSGILFRPRLSTPPSGVLPQ